MLATFSVHIDKSKLIFKIIAFWIGNKTRLNLAAQLEKKWLIKPATTIKVTMTHKIGFLIIIPFLIK